MVDVNFHLLDQELNDRQVESFDSVEQRSLLLLIQQLKISSKTN